VEDDKEKQRTDQDILHLSLLQGIRLPPPPAHLLDNTPNVQAQQLDPSKLKCRRKGQIHHETKIGRKYQRIL